MSIPVRFDWYNKSGELLAAIQLAAFLDMDIVSSAALRYVRV
jgi:hypothetical protein